LGDDFLSGGGENDIFRYCQLFCVKYS
jgi:hypothetical protein